MTQPAGSAESVSGKTKGMEARGSLYLQTGTLQCASCFTRVISVSHPSPKVGEQSLFTDTEIDSEGLSDSPEMTQLSGKVGSRY